jgi:Uma2 family endonuclease
MAMSRAIQPVTVNEFVLRVGDGQKADLLDGVIYMASPDSPEAADANGFLHTLLNYFVRRRKLGKIYGPRSAFRLFPGTDETWAPEPDIAFVREQRLKLWKGSVFQGPPDLAVEIVSTESIDRDTITKRAAYERARVGEYWIIDLLQRKCTFLRLERDAYLEIETSSGAFRSDVVKGFWLDTRWILAEELPPPDACLEKILGSPGPA